MSSFNNLLSRLTFLNEAAVSPMDRILPGFQTQARGIATSKGASSSTREGRLAMLKILYDLDIIDDNVRGMFWNSSVSHMVDYFEQNGIAEQMKARKSDIEEHIADQLENKISFTTGNRTDAAKQKMEMNKLKTELKAIERAAREDRKRNTATVFDSVGKTIEDNYKDLIKSIRGSYTGDYMIRIAVADENDLNDLHEISKYLKKFIKDDDIEIARSTVQATFSSSTKLGRLIDKLGVEEVEDEIMRNLKYLDVGVVIYPPESNSKLDMIGDLGREEEEGYGGVEEEEADSDFNKLAEDYKDTELVPEVMNAQKKAVEAALGRTPIKESSILNYMSEQRVYSTPKPIVESLSFRDKYKPTTAKQLAELRSYGM